MQYIAKCLILFFLTGFSVIYAAPLKIGVVDVERLLQESSPAVAAEKKIEQTFSRRDQEIKQLIQRVEQLKSELERNATQMTEETLRARERKLNNMNVDLQRKQREFHEDLNMRKNEELVVVMELANKAIRRIAAEEHYDLILQEVVYRAPALDITDQVIQYMGRGR